MTQGNINNQNARRHGLTARGLATSLDAQARVLAQDLLAGCLNTSPELEEAALQLAGKMVLVAAIRQAITEEVNRRASQSSPAARFNNWVRSLPEPKTVDKALRHALRSNATPSLLDLMPSTETMAWWHKKLETDYALTPAEQRISRLQSVLVPSPRWLKRLQAYESRATGQLTKAMNRFDYLTIEAMMTGCMRASHRAMK